MTCAAQVIVPPRSKSILHKSFPPSKPDHNENGFLEKRGYDILQVRTRYFCSTSVTCVWLPLFPRLLIKSFDTLLNAVPLVCRGTGVGHGRTKTSGKVLKNKLFWWRYHSSVKEPKVSMSWFVRWTSHVEYHVARTSQSTMQYQSYWKFPQDLRPPFTHLNKKTPAFKKSCGSNRTSVSLSTFGCLVPTSHLAAKLDILASRVGTCSTNCRQCVDSDRRIFSNRIQ